MVEVIFVKKEEKIPETLVEIELEVSSALESLVRQELAEPAQKDVLVSAELNRFSEAVIKNEDSSFQNDSFSPAEYSRQKDSQQTFDYAYSSDKHCSVYDSKSEQEVEIKEEVAEEIKSQKIANTWNVQGEQKGDPSLAKKAAQEFYKMINFTMNTVLYDLAEA